MDIPFQAQHYILETVQRRLERCGFEFAQRWLPKECDSIHWKHPEPMELQKILQFLDKHWATVRSNGFYWDSTALLTWRRSITGIRHAAVHRICQDRVSLGQKLDAAVVFAQYLGDEECEQEIRYFRSILDLLLASMDNHSRELKCKVKTQFRLGRIRPQKWKTRRSLLPEAIKRVVEQNERDFSLRIEEYLRRVLC